MQSQKYRVVSIAINDKHVVAGTLCGCLLWWSLKEIKSELEKPES